MEYPPGEDECKRIDAVWTVLQDSDESMTFLHTALRTALVDSPPEDRRVYRKEIQDSLNAQRKALPDYPQGLSDEFKRECWESVQRSKDIAQAWKAESQRGFFEPFPNWRGLWNNPLSLIGLKIG